MADLKAAYKDRINAHRKQPVVASIRGQVKELQKSAYPPPPPPPVPAQPSTEGEAAPIIKSQPSSKSPPGVKTLASFLDVEKCLALPPKELETVWRLRHSDNPQSLCAVIPRGIYKIIADNARLHPQFILPLPREGAGAEIHFLQWTFPHKDTAHVLFTHLAEYKLRGEYAAPHTTVTIHTELLDEKSVALAQGIVQESRGISVEDAKWLLMCLQKFYGFTESIGSESRKTLMDQFSQGDEQFNIGKLLEEAERF